MFILIRKMDFAVSLVRENILEHTIITIVALI